MAKKWKNSHYDYFDYDDRDAATMILDGVLYIGSNGATHATMVQEIVYGMDFTKPYQELYDEKWNGGNDEGILFYRYDVEDDIEDSHKYMFGHLVGNSVYWDIGNISSPERAINTLPKDKYTHYLVRGNNTLLIRRG